LLNHSIIKTEERPMQEIILSKLESIEALLINQTNKPLSFRKASEYLGISLSYLYKLTSLKKIPHYKPNGKMIYFVKSELDQWIINNPSKPNEGLNGKPSEYINLYPDNNTRNN
jgi:excisionase family DNA binding protein